MKVLANDQYEVEFHYQAKPGTKSVYLAGEFNKWNTTEHKMDGPDAQNRFITKQVLNAGKHEYKFMVDGKTWRNDPGNPRQAGMYNNSLLTLPGKLRAVLPTGAGGGGE